MPQYGVESWNANSLHKINCLWVLIFSHFFLLIEKKPENSAASPGKHVFAMLRCSGSSFLCYIGSIWAWICGQKKKNVECYVRMPGKCLQRYTRSLLPKLLLGSWEHCKSLLEQGWGGESSNKIFMIVLLPSREFGKHFHRLHTGLLLRHMKNPLEAYEYFFISLKRRVVCSS